MQRLEASDLGRVVRFLGEAAEVETDDPFPPELLATFRRLIPCDVVCFSEQDRVERKSLSCTGFPDDEDEEHIPFDVYWRLRHEHPVCHYQDVTGDFRAFKWTDFVSGRELRRRQIYAELFRATGTEYQLVAGLDAPFWHTKVFTFNRGGGRDFGERDRDVLDVLRPNLAQLYRAAQARRRLREVLAVHERSEGGAVVLLDRGDRIAFASTAARDLLDRYFGKTGVRLPDELRSRLREPRQAAPHELLRVDARDRSLVVHFVDGALLLEERPRIACLTPREREILDLVATVRTNAEIAEALCLSPGTVRRHLENSFAKLGVHTRTAAAAMFRDGNSFGGSAEQGR
jgi:DNA-binding CsgD family transcriptional regulator